MGGDASVTGHSFYDRLEERLASTPLWKGFASRHMRRRWECRRFRRAGYLEGIDSERASLGAGRTHSLCAISCGCQIARRLPIIPGCLSRLPHEAHEKVLGFVLKLVAERGLVKGEARRSQDIRQVWWGGSRRPGDRRSDMHPRNIFRHIPVLRSCDL